LEAGRVAVGGCTVSYDPETAECEVAEDMRSNGKSIYKIEFRLKDGVKEFSCSVR
jgi:hypothetical protein